MTQTVHFTAVISISLPDTDKAVTANVALTPADAIPVHGRYKSLHECTLADLQQFADALEADAWQTYQEIRLVELVNDKQVRVKLDVLDDTGAPVPPTKDWNWSEQVVMLPEQTEADLTTEAEPETADSVAPVEATESADSTESVAVAKAEPDTPVATDQADDEPGDGDTAEDLPETETAETETEELKGDEEPEEPLPEIVVADTEPIYEEREVDEWDGIDDNGAAVIAPSQARVRIAGKQRPIGDTTWAAVDIMVEEPALRQAQAHALTSLSREVAGVLIGPRPEKQPDGRYIVQVIDTIMAKYTVMQGASVTYTPESWRYMNDKLHERYPDDTAVIVGWYHTHPGFGIFLSGMDLFIHQNFFTQIWHIALVLDPRARTSGFFCWNRPQTQVSRYEFPWPSWAAGSW